MGQITLQGVRKSFGSVNIIKDANLDIEDGSFVVFVGPSGCGKTTLLRLIAGLEDVTGGKILIDGRNVVDVPPAKRGLSMVFQSYALYPHMSVRGNIGFGLKMAGLPKDEINRKVEAAAATLNLTPYLDRKPRELSGGQRQRVALGRAIVREPKVFLFDEPLSNLDAKLRVQMRAEIARLHQRLKTTIIYVTHDQVEAMTLGDRIVLMDRGVIQQVDTPMNIYQRPANQFVASFIGSPAMNFIPGNVEGGSFRFAQTNGDQTATVAVGNAVPGGPVTLGVRPEDLIAGEESSGSSGRFATVVLDVVEHMGHETMAHFALAGNQHVARLPATARVQPGDKLPLSIRSGAYHLFAADDGRRLN